MKPESEAPASTPDAQPINRPAGPTEPHIQQPVVVGPQGFNNSQPANPEHTPSVLNTGSQPHVFHAAESGPATVTSAAVAKPPRTKRRILLIALLTLLTFLIVGAVGAYAYYTIQNNKPEKVLADALSNTMTDLLDRKPSSAIGSVKYEFKGEDEGTISLDFSSKVAGDNYQQEATMKIKMGEIDASFKGSMIGIGTEEAYVKFDDLQKTLDQLHKSQPEYKTLTQSYEPIIKKIDGRWIKIDKDSLVDYGFAESEEEVDKCSAAFTNLRISKDDQKQLKEAFLSNQFAIASEKLPKESIDGESSYHYKLDFNEERSIQFVKSIIELESFKALKADCDLKPEDYDKQIEDLKKSAESQTEKVKPVIELWVGSKTRRPTKLKVSTQDSTLTMEFVATIKINGSSIQVEAPEESLSIQELKSDFDALLGAELSSTSEDTERETDIKALHGQIEAYYAQNGYYPTITQLNNPDFRKTNMPGLDDGAFQSPNGSTTQLSEKINSNSYSYAAAPKGCGNKSCQSYKLSTVLSNGETYSRESLNL